MNYKVNLKQTNKLNLINYFSHHSYSNLQKFYSLTFPQNLPPNQYLNITNNQKSNLLYWNQLQQITSHPSPLQYNTKLNIFC